MVYHIYAIDISNFKPTLALLKKGEASFHHPLTVHDTLTSKYYLNIFTYVCSFVIVEASAYRVTLFIIFTHYEVFQHTLKLVPQIIRAI